MLLIDKMKTYEFSGNERIIVDYILASEEQIELFSTREIAEQTFTSPSTLVRVAKKLNYSGWNSLKKAYLEELSYLKNHFNEIDANLPFKENDTLRNITKKIAALSIESINDSVSLIKQDQLQKAIQIMRNSEVVHIFGVSNILYVAQEFEHKLNRIDKEAKVSTRVGDTLYDAAKCMTTDCAVIISYSGETVDILEVCKLLRKNKVPIIAVTSIGNNSLSQFATVSLSITTREKEYSKIGNFSSATSMALVLDILYAGLFAADYQKNLSYKFEMAKQIESRHPITNPIIFEDLSE